MARTPTVTEALLISESAMLERMRAAVDTIIAHHRQNDPRGSALVARINQAADAMRRHLPAVIAASRADARSVALRTVHAEADRLARALREAGDVADLPPLPAPSDSRAADIARAKRSGVTLADAWLGAAMVAATAGEAKGKGLREIARIANRETEHRFARTIATENSTAFNDERTKAASQMAATKRSADDRKPTVGRIEPAPKVQPLATATTAGESAGRSLDEVPRTLEELGGPSLDSSANPRPRRPIDVAEPRNGQLVAVRVWDATLDAATCSVCRAADGVWTELGMPFLLHGHEVEPGQVHPNCRCVAHIATRRV